MQKTVDDKQPQIHAKLLLESITSASGKQFKTLALRIEQMARKTYVNNAPDMRNAQMKYALVKALDPPVALIALKKYYLKSPALEPHFPFAHSTENIHQND